MGADLRSNRQPPTTTGLLHHAELLEKIFILRHPFLNKADDALLIDQIGYPASAVFFLNILFRVGDKREADIFFTNEFLKRFHVVVTDPDYLCPEFFKCLQITLEVGKLAGSDRAECGKVECQNDMLLSGIIVQGELTLIGQRREGRRLISHFKSKSGRRKHKQATNRQNGDRGKPVFHFQTSVIYPLLNAGEPAMLQYIKHVFSFINRRLRWAAWMVLDTGVSSPKILEKRKKLCSG
jgi:hypothetical protein